MDVSDATWRCSDRLKEDWNKLSYSGVFGAFSRVLGDSSLGGGAKQIWTTNYVDTIYCRVPLVPGRLLLYYVWLVSAHS